MTRSMRSLLTAAVVLAVALVSSPAFAARTLAVLPLVKGAGPEQYEGLGTALAGMLVSDLSTVPDLTLVERERLRDLLAEIHLGKSGFLDKKTARELGNGIGAEFLVTGSFSVVDGTFLMDTRLVQVESGKVLAAIDASGPARDFVAVEKDIVEDLLDRMEIRLSSGDRRKLLIETPTEDVDALASYGRGLDAQDLGDLEAARAAYRKAVERDPAFAQASAALAALRSRVEEETKSEYERMADAHTRARLDALAQLTPETERKKRFQDTIASKIDLSIRLELLRSTGQYCTLYAEQAHYLERTEGKATTFVDDLPAPDHFERYEQGRQRMGKRGEELGLTGKDEDVYGIGGMDLMSRTGFLGSPSGMLTWTSLSARSFSDDMAWSLARCHDPLVQESEWRRWMAWAEQRDLLDTPLSPRSKEPDPRTLRDAMELHLAWLLATHHGFDDRVAALTEGILARYPEGAPERFAILNAVKDVVTASEQRERRIATRMGLDAATLEAATVALVTRDAEALRLDVPFCAAVVHSANDWPKRQLDGYLEARERGLEQGIERSLNSLGSVVAPPLLARCYTSAEEPPLDLDGVVELVREALERVHPAGVEEQRCVKARADLAQEVTEERVATIRGWGETAWHGHARGWLWRVHSLRSQRCLTD